MTQTQGRWAFDVEEWKAVVGFEDRYEVSSFGQVRSIPYIKKGKNINGIFSFKTTGKLLKQCESTDHYLQIQLSKNNCKRGTGVHRIMAEAFIPNPDNLPQVNHIDGNKQNNHISNLEWCSAQHNVIHSYTLGLACNKQERHPLTVLTHDKVFRMAEMRYKGFSYKQISEELDLKYDTVWKVINRKNWVESYDKAIEVIKNGK